MPNFQTATVIKNEVLAAKFHDLVLQTETSFSFLPGQFVSIKINETKMNAYSVAGKLNDKQFGLLIDTEPGGLGSQYIDKLKPGDKVEFMGPLGHMTLKLDDGATNLYFMSTGCGIAPLKAMIEAALVEYKTDKQLTLYLGLRHCNDVFWDQYFNDLQNRFTNFHFKLVLSKPEGAWCGVAGHITDLAKVEVKDPVNSAVYICGSVRMADEAIKLFEEMGTPKARIYFEKYG